MYYFSILFLFCFFRILFKNHKSGFDHKPRFGHKLFIGLENSKFEGFGLSSQDFVLDLISGLVSCAGFAYN